MEKRKYFTPEIEVIEIETEEIIALSVENDFGGGVEEGNHHRSNTGQYRTQYGSYSEE